MPQRGYTRIVLHSVPVVRTNGLVPSSGEILAELQMNQVCQGLLMVSPPKWLRSTIELEKTQSSIIFSIIDESGAALARILRDPPYLFGAQSVAKLFNSLLLARQCDRCHHLGHLMDRCQFSKTVVICLLCGGSHQAKDHARKCLTIKNHTGMFCNCPPHCINCRGAKLPDAGHVAHDLSCPLRKKFWHEDNRTGNSSSEDLSRPMAVDLPFPPSHIPSSQPDKDDIVTYVPRSPARVDIVAPSLLLNPTNRPVPTALQTHLKDVAKWTAADFAGMSIIELNSLPELAHAAAISRSINISNLIWDKSKLILSDSDKSTNYV